MFSTIDYVVFFGMLLISAFIGIYFGFCGKPQTTDDYLLGGKTMKITPIALSLIAGHISGITLLALPSDVYLFGANYLWLCISLIIIYILTSFVYLPVVSKLQNPSVFEYLNRRFNRSIRIMASLLYTLQLILYNPVVAYIPAIAFSQGKFTLKNVFKNCIAASGISTYLITPIICILCIFYTTIGGFKAVVWTDAIQFIGMITSIITIFSLGIKSVGGFTNMFTIATEGQRLHFDFSLDPTIREGFFPILLGGTILWLYNVALQPSSVQKYISVSNLPNARKTLLLLVFGLAFLKVSNAFIGIIMYAKYEKCDPLSTKEVTRTDQILPYFVMDVAKHAPGVPGIFIAGIFSAALSTLSTMFNTLSATIYGDFISPFMPAGTSQNKISYILKLIVIVSGTICTALTFFVDQMGGLFHFINASQGLIAGLFITLFSLGMIFPIANSKGAFWGVFSSFCCVGTILVINQTYKLQGIIDVFPKPVSVDGCGGGLNVTLTKSTIPYNQPFFLFRLSHWYNAFLSAVVGTIVGLIVSWFTREKNVYIDPDLISPISQFLLAKQNSPKTECNINNGFEMNICESENK